MLAMPAELNPAQSWEESLLKTVGVAHTFKKAYEVGLFLAGITRPDCSYRKSLERLKLTGAASVQQSGGEAKLTIVKAKLYNNG